MDMRHRYDLLMQTAVRTPGGCLIATMGAQHEGYRRAIADGKWMLAHRLVMEVHLGRPLLPSPAETVDHLCHNADTTCLGGYDCPHRECIDVAHLEVVDLATNWRRGRQGAPVMHRAKTHCPAGHEYSPENLRSGVGRACKQCHAARERARRATART